jgi:hypothetical protein
MPFAGISFNDCRTCESASTRIRAIGRISFLSAEAASPQRPPNQILEGFVAFSQSLRPRRRAIRGQSRSANQCDLPELSLDFR